MDKNVKIIDANALSLIEYLGQLKKQIPYISTFLQRDIKIKYANTLLGIGWQIGLPLIQIFIFSVFYGWFFSYDKSFQDAVIFVTSGFLIWNIFIQSLQQIGSSFLQQFQIIKRTPITPIVVPISKLLNIILDQSILLISIVILLLLSSIAITVKILWTIPILILLLYVSLGLGLFINVLSTYKRDILLLLPYIQLVGIWFTPVFYPISFIPEQVQKIFYLQPIAAFIDLFKWSLNIQESFSNYSIGGVLIGIVLATISWWWYRRQEPYLVDRL